MTHIKLIKIAVWLHEVVFDAAFPFPAIILVDSKEMGLYEALAYNDHILFSRDILSYNRKQAVALLCHELIHIEDFHTRENENVIQKDAHGFWFVKRTQEIWRDHGIFIQCPSEAHGDTDDYAEMVDDV